jgi:adiponectin receptor
MFRASLFFFGMGVSGVAPILHKVVVYKDEPVMLYTTAYEISMGVFYGFGAVVYATRIPE